MILDYKDFKLTENFNISEFHCKDGNRVPYGYVLNCLYIACQIQILRNILGSPIIINSAYRTYDHNKKIGGKPHSNHLQACAVDICQRRIPHNDFVKLLKELVSLNIIPNGEIVVYDTFVHYAPFMQSQFFPVFNGKEWSSPQEVRSELQEVKLKYNL